MDSTLQIILWGALIWGIALTLLLGLLFYMHRQYAILRKEGAALATPLLTQKEKQ
jgi:hypothetical protein